MRLTCPFSPTAKPVASIFLLTRKYSCPHRTSSIEHTRPTIKERTALRSAHRVRAGKRPFPREEATQKEGRGRVFCAILFLPAPDNELNLAGEARTPSCEARKEADGRLHLHHRRDSREARQETTPKRVAGIVIGVIVGAALCIGIGFGALGLLNDTLGKKHQAPIALSEQTVLTSLNAERLAPPDLSGYAHLSTDNLLGPRYDNLSIGEIADDGGSAPHRDVTAVATFDNSYLTISAPLTARFVFDEGEHRVGHVRAKPGSPFRQAAARLPSRASRAASSSCSQATTPRSGRPSPTRAC